MPMNVIGKTSRNNENMVDTSKFVQEPNLRTNYLESNTEKDFDFKQQFENEKQPNPISMREAASNSYVEKNI